MTTKNVLSNFKFIMAVVAYLFAGLFLYITSVHAEVRFITDKGERETFKFPSSCPNSYIACVSPKIGVGTVCDGKYASCQCPSTYAACESPKTGENAVGCDGKFLSSDCQCPSDYDTLCNDSNSVIASGAVSCDGKYKAEDCQCPSGWFTSSTCASPKELGGGTCTANSVTYRETCRCPSNYLTCTNGGETGGKSCTDDSGTKYTSCKETTCEALGYYSTWGSWPNDKKCTYASIPEITSGGCYKDCTDAPACSSGLGGGDISANARISLTGENNGICTFKVAGNCEYAGFTSSSPRASKSDFDLLVKYFSSNFQRYQIYSVRATCGSSMRGYKIASGDICVLWYEPTSGNTCSQAGASSVKSDNNNNICYKCEKYASNIASYVCYEPGFVTSLTSVIEFCTGTYSMRRNTL